MHTLANVSEFVVSVRMSTEKLQEIDVDLRNASNDRKLLNTMDITKVLGQDLARRYFHWYGNKMRTKQKALN